MFFWVCLTIFELLLVIIALSFRQYTKKIVYINLFILWLLASFRYMIGADYAQYMNWYIYGVESNPLLQEDLEASFVILVSGLNEIGCSFQSVFIFYETISLVFFYKGLRFYIKDELSQLIALVLYCFIYSGFWYSMNNIRAVAAIGVLFWGSKFIVEKKIVKFFLAILMAFVLHHSTAFFLLAYTANYITVKNKFVIVAGSILISGIIGYNQLFIGIVLFMMNFLSDYGDKYASFLVAMNGKWAVSFDMIIIVTTLLIGTLFKRLNCGEKNQLCYKLSFLYCVLFIIMNIQFDSAILTDVFSRISKYFFFFYLVFLTNLIDILSKKISPSYIIIVMACLCYGLEFNYFIYKVDIDPIAKAMLNSLSQGNIDYEFNFSLFK